VSSSCDGVTGEERHRPNTPQSASFAWCRGGGRVYDRGLAVLLLESCIAVGQGTITQAGGREKTKWAPVPLATVELQKRASRHLGISSAQTMDIAEKLYQSGVLSYPRTETDQFPQTMNLKDLVQLQTGSADGAVAQYANALVTNSAQKMRRPRNGGHNDQAHPPIHPTGLPSGSLHGNEKKIYDYVVRHFLACVSHDARGKSTEVHLCISSEEFVAKGSMVTEKNYLEIYPWEKWANNTLPTFREGQTVVPDQLTVEQSSTSPAGYLSEADLIAKMDREGIGTDATIATHIQTVLERGYAEKNASSQFMPTTLGCALLAGYDQMQRLTTDLSNPELRREMEKDMLRISHGQRRKEAVVRDSCAQLSQIFRAAQLERNQLTTAVGQYFGRHDTGMWQTVDAHFSDCGRCGSTMALKQEPVANGGRGRGRGAGRGARRGGTGRGRGRGSVTKRCLHCTRCDESHIVPHNGQLAAHTHRCPLCQFQVLSVTNESTQKTHSVCPYCFNNPPPASGKTPGQFRCFMCTESCPLASSPSVAVQPCPQCGDNLLVKKGRDGNYRLGCSGYPNCKEATWFPSQVTHINVLDSSCQRCRLHPRLLEFTFRSGSVSLGLVSDPANNRHVGCVRCDTLLNDLLGGTRRGNITMTASGAGANGAPLPAPALAASVRTLQANLRSSGGAVVLGQRPIAQTNGATHPHTVSNVHSRPMCHCGVQATRRKLNDGTNVVYACDKCDFYMTPRAVR
jgi:DNA topoisomerase-3